MKNIILTIALITISLTVFGQRKLEAGTTVRYPKTENQITKEDSLSDESGREYFEKEFQGVEEDTATQNAQFRKMEKLQEKTLMPVEKPDGPNLEEIYWMNSDEMEKNEELEKKEEEKAIKEKNAVVKPKK